MSASAENLKLVAMGDVAGRREGEAAVRRDTSRTNEPLLKRFLRFVFPDQRKQERISVPPLVGYLGTMRATRPFEIGDISASGFSLLTHERWEKGTEMPITLQKTNQNAESEAECFTVQATVVRWGEQSIGFSIVLSEEESNAAHGNRLQVRWASKPEMERFLQSMNHELASTPEPSRVTQTESVSYLGETRQFLTHSAGD